ncbi:4'-phosphopantetheinyl transferase EntD (siderophore biosynthesis) [Micromonospora echinaurantiaca]|uniref:4'-phosphopantetheinyl transferase EntD (Siderophore biosynthesis) n=1 Tax=Micromonospora echinaurantiaca TaxID=47857 RepID=A0A1C5HLU5_9ACTN|nr:4'-phosphopantetheinyl transferase superfamily protein [Micromonospora echinaurantiaca]SCG46982.1 4'-phosphopantetheinyl transferase EntD (siderophore biosynthesis) [Micromonospora echinaurantiaca]
MLGELLPAAVRVAERPDDDPTAVPLAEEAEAVARAGAGRRGEFLTGRACARRALARFGVPPVAIPRGADRAPRWPAGFVGSITHCRGYRGAAVARRADLLAVGVDAEPHRPLPPRVAERVLLPAERRWLRGQPPGAALDTVLFSAKESVYKVWHPVTGRWLGFRDALVRLDPAGTFTVELLVPAPDCLRGITGRFRIGDGLVLTAAAVPA